jgi:uncharacterized membrane protein YjjB (DUF3815 family)
MMGAIVGSLEHAAWAGVAASCFAILLNVPRRALLACALTGLLAYEVRSVVTSTGLADGTVASLGASLLVSLSSVGWGRRLRAPAIVFVLPGIIPLIPGALAFRTIVGLVRILDGRLDEPGSVLLSVSLNGLRTAFVTAALASGVALPSMLLRRKRPIL